MSGTVIVCEEVDSPPQSKSKAERMWWEVFVTVDKQPMHRWFGLLISGMHSYQDIKKLQHALYKHYHTDKGEFKVKTRSHNANGKWWIYIFKYTPDE